MTRRILLFAIACVVAVAALGQVSVPTLIQILDEAASQGVVRSVNFTGAGVTATVTGAAGTVTIPDAGVLTEETTTSTGTVNDFDLDGRRTFLRLNNATALTINGFSVLGAAPQGGDRVVLASIGAGHVFFGHQVMAATAANRLINFATSAATPVAAGVGTAEYLYDDTTDRWRLVTHIQGAPVTSAFAAGNFVSTNAAGTWTVDSGDVVSMSHYLDGRAFTMYIFINATTWAGAWNRVNIDNAAWGDFTADGGANFTHVGYMFDPVAGNMTTQVFIEGGDLTKIGITRFDNANFGVGTNLLYFRMVLTTAVQ